MDGYEGISVVAPVFNQAGNLRPLYQAVARQMGGLGHSCEFVFVDDGSDDDAMAVLRELAAEDSRVRALRLSRPFGAAAAITAGLTHSRGLAALVIDASLEHPAELIPQMVAAWREGAHIVRAAGRHPSRGGWLRRWLGPATEEGRSRRAGGALEADAFLFGLLDRAAIDALLSMPQRRFSRGAFPVPHLATALGLAASLAGLLACGWAIGAGWLAGIEAPGWALASSAVVFLGGVQLTGIGLLGRYLRGLHAEVRGRPLYVASELVGFDRPRRRADRSTAILGFPSVSPFRLGGP